MAKPRTLGDAIRDGTFAPSSPGFWQRLAAVRDEKLRRYPPPPVYPHDPCRRRPVRLLLMGHHACPPCAARKLKWMHSWKQRSFLRATADRLIRDYRLCDRCFHRLADCGCLELTHWNDEP